MRAVAARRAAVSGDGECLAQRKYWPQNEFGVIIKFCRPFWNVLDHACCGVRISATPDDVSESDVTGRDLAGSEEDRFPMAGWLIIREWWREWRRHALAGLGLSFAGVVFLCVGLTVSPDEIDEDSREGVLWLGSMLLLCGLGIIGAYLPWSAAERARLRKGGDIYRPLRFDFDRQMEKIRRRLTERAQRIGEPLPDLVLPDSWENCVDDFVLIDFGSRIRYAGFPAMERVEEQWRPVFLVLGWHDRWIPYGYRLPRDRQLLQEFCHMLKDESRKMDEEVLVFDRRGLPTFTWDEVERTSREFDKWLKSEEHRMRESAWGTPTDDGADRH